MILSGPDYWQLLAIFVASAGLSPAAPFQEQH